jgi:predicted amino acid dehydrogenase
MAEAILLTFEGRFVSHSLNEETNPDNLEEIADIAVQHGFEVWVPEAPVL